MVITKYYKKFIGFIERYGFGLSAPAYLVAYLVFFSILEKINDDHYHIIHMAADDLIPFNEYFVIPYILWFLYVPAVIAYFIFSGKKREYMNTMVFLSTGMTIFLIISAIYPNGCHLRPTVFPRDNFFTSLVMKLYSIDTSTNIFPSIHVYNAIGAHLAVLHSEELSKSRIIRTGSFFLCLSIILSTMLLKQHSVFDVATALVLSVLMYVLVYVVDFQPMKQKEAVQRFRLSR